LSSACEVADMRFTACKNRTKATLISNMNCYFSRIQLSSGRLTFFELWSCFDSKPEVFFDSITYWKASDTISSTDAQDRHSRATKSTRLTVAQKL